MGLYQDLLDITTMVAFGCIIIAMLLGRTGIVVLSLADSTILMAVGILLLRALNKEEGE